MAGTTIKLAIIGTGGIARSHMNGYRAIKEKAPDLFELVAVCDAVPAAAEAFAAAVAEWQGKAPKVYTKVEEMLESERLDGAYICSPHHLHHTLGIACMDAGVNVMIEKPIGITVKATQKLIEKQEQTGLICATAEQIRRQPGPRTAHWAINEKELIGRPTQFFVQLGTYRAPDPTRPWHWRATMNMGGGGLAIDSGAHFCDTMRYLWGDVESVYGHTWQHIAKTLRKDGVDVPVEQEDSFVATLNFKSGLVGVWAFGTSLSGAQYNNVVYYGTSGALNDPGDPFHGPRMTGEWRFADGTARSMENVHRQYLEELGPAGREKVFPLGLTEGFALEVYDFITAIRDRRPVEVPVQQGLLAKAIAQTLYESAARGELVRVADVLSGEIDDYQRGINEALEL
jgi:UDP-N-acetyl-2-amino-2-deoxyglucuronate dehydrogenase